MVIGPRVVQPGDLPLTAVSAEIALPPAAGVITTVACALAASMSGNSGANTERAFLPGERLVFISTLQGPQSPVVFGRSKKLSVKIVFTAAFEDNGKRAFTRAVLIGEPLAVKTRKLR